VGLTNLTGGYRSDQSDRWVPIWPVCDDEVRNLRAEDTRRDRKACVEAKQVAVAGHPSNGESLKTSKTTLEGLVFVVVRKGYFRLSVASI
jgi:hypothetical protein